LHSRVEAQPSQNTAASSTNKAKSTAMAQQDEIKTTSGLMFIRMTMHAMEVEFGTNPPGR